MPQQGTPSVELGGLEPIEAPGYLAHGSGGVALLGKGGGMRLLAEAGTFQISKTGIKVLVRRRI